MTLFSTAQHIARGSRARSRGHMIPIALGCAITSAAMALVAYLLWPTWGADASSSPARLPVSIGATLFNVPTMAIRMKIQRHSGPQERVDLAFAFPSLEPPDLPKHVSADAIEETMQPIDRIFVSIAAHHDSLAPDTRVRTIYPRYLEQASAPGQDGLTRRAFRDGTPYSNEDLFLAGTPNLNARCTRDAGNVPERAPDRRGRSDVSFSAELAGAMARGGQCDGAIDGAVAWAEGVSGGLKAFSPARPDRPRGSPSGTGMSGRRPRHRRTARR
jgi:hypothetical protein